MFVEETFHDRCVSTDTFGKAQAHFTVAELVEMSLVTGYYVMTAGFLNSFEIDIEGGGRGLVSSFDPSR